MGAKNSAKTRNPSALLAYVRNLLYLCSRKTHTIIMLTLLIPILCQLDTAVMNRQSYIALREQQIAVTTAHYHIAEGQKKYQFAQDLWSQYNGFNNDSALYYAEAAAELASSVPQRQEADIHIANCLSVGGNYTGALAMLLPMRDTLSPEVANIYYKTLNLTYIWQAEFSTVDEDQRHAREHIGPLRDLTLQTETDSIWMKQELALLEMESNPRRALGILLPTFMQLDENADYVRYLANTLGSCYQRLYWQTDDPHMQDSALYYYAVSALSDLRHGVMEHASLREVALLLFRREDIERAYQYMNCCIQDAKQSRARLRTIEMAGDMPLILNAYQQHIKEQQHKQQVLSRSVLAVAIAFACMIVVLVILLRRYLRINSTLDKKNRQLHSLNTQLEHVNTELTYSNRIRDTYLTRYIAECSDIIETLTQYHKTLRRTALSDNPKQLLALVKSDDIIDKTLKEFYRHFDESFLSLFPDFTEDLNSVLPPEEQFTVPADTPDTPKHLTTELRIYALVRLGITRSEDIARFLRTSTKTVSNYRTQARNNAVQKQQPPTA